MQLRKFYGRTVSLALAQVKRELGPDALILETNLIPPDSPSARLAPGARYEVLAARDPRSTYEPQPATPAPMPPPAVAPAPAAPRAAPPATPRAPFQTIRDSYLAANALQPAREPQHAREPQAASRQPLAPREPQNARLPQQPAREPRLWSELQPTPERPFASAAQAPRSPEPAAARPVPTDFSLPQPGPAFARTAAPQHKADLLEDLGLLRSQISQLLESSPAGLPGEPGQLDIADYHSLIAQGVNHEILMPHFRQWLAWRTTPAVHRAHLARLEGGPALRMRGESLREWLWLVWTEQLGIADLGLRNADCSSAERGVRSAENWVADRSAGVPPASSVAECGMRNAEQSAGPKVVALVGSTGSGKTTTLAKLASISRHAKRQNAVILTLDTFRFGATEQWRRLGRLMGIDVEEITSSIDISKSMERWGNYDWVGIDTPGGITPENAPGILYGSILAQYPAMESVIVLPATQQESVSREQMKRYRALGARSVLFSKLDETTHNGGIINLTMDGKWKIDSFATGSRVPEDWEPASREALWRRVLAPQTLLGGTAA